MDIDARRAAELERRLSLVGTPERAEHEQRYFKNELRHLGELAGRLGLGARRQR
jgi:hypothetical protein